MSHKYMLEWAGQRLTLGPTPLVMGIVNVTPDSFSDGGKFFSHQAAISHGLELARQGANILDIGGESTRPFSEPVSEEEQIERVVPVIKALAQKVRIPISIDTTKSVVAKAALKAGASIINDISSLQMDPKMAELASKSGAPIILMHMQGTPENMQVNPSYQDLIGDIISFFKTSVAKATAAGIKPNNIIIDPGIGFGKTIAHNFSLIAQIEQFQALDLPILVGHSRKAFIRKTVKSNEVDDLPPEHPLVETGTQAVVAALAMKGVQIIRVHNVANTVATLKIIEKLIQS